MNLLFCIIYNPLSLEQEDLNVYLYCAPCVGGMVCVHSGAQNNSNCGIHCGNRHACMGTVKSPLLCCLSK